MKKLCTILARGGSKGVKNKNIRLLNGLPLIAFTIQQAQNSKIFDSIVVSSDSEEILEISKKYGVDYLIKRPDNLARDDSPKIPAIVHALIEAEKHFSQNFDIIIDLDPTSPLRLVEDIANAYAMLLNNNADNVITASPARRSPYFNMVVLDENNNAILPMSLEKKVTRRQDAPQLYDMNASIYVWKRETLLEKQSIWNSNTKLYVMPEERSHDIDSELDFQIVEGILIRSING